MTVTRDSIRVQIAELLDVPEQRVVGDAVLSDLVTDSFRLVELAIGLQEDYDVMFGQADLATLHTVTDLVELVHSRLPSERSAP